MSKDFWDWVVSRKAHDNPRGDFIRETRELLADNIRSLWETWGTCREAQDEFNRLRKQYNKLYEDRKRLVSLI